MAISPKHHVFGTARRYVMGPVHRKTLKPETNRAWGEGVDPRCQAYRNRHWVLGLSCAVCPGPHEDAEMGRSLACASATSLVYSIVFGLTPEPAREHRDAPKRHFTRKNASNLVRIVLLKKFPVNQDLQLRIQKPCGWSEGCCGTIRDSFNRWE